jgi:glycosyltransferase involved in cell wall biosynthesis
MYHPRSVLVLTTSFPLNSSIAAGIHIIEKCRALVKNNVTVKVIAPHHAGSKKKETTDGIDVHRFRYFFRAKWQCLAYGAGIPTNLKTSWSARLQLPFFMLAFLYCALKEAKHFDVIHCHWSIAGLIGILAGKLFSKKIVLMIHGAEVFVLGDNPVLQFVFRHVDFLICNSTFTEKKVLGLCSKKKHAVIPPGVDIHRFCPQRKIPTLRKNLNIAPEEIFVLAVGKFIERKGFEYLIEAFNIIVHQKHMTHIKLRIAGRGPLIKDEDMASYYTEADMFVLPSIVDHRGDTEGLGVVFLEANACQTPVIGSKVGGIIDVIHHGQNGFLVEQKNSLDLAEKIIALAGDKELRKKMGENGRKIVAEQFNWDQIAHQIIHVYDSILT